MAEPKVFSDEEILKRLGVQAQPSEEGQPQPTQTPAQPLPASGSTPDQPKVFSDEEILKRLGVEPGQITPQPQVTARPDLDQREHIGLAGAFEAGQARTVLQSQEFTADIGQSLESSLGRSMYNLGSRLGVDKLRQGLGLEARPTPDDNIQQILADLEASKSKEGFLGAQEKTLKEFADRGLEITDWKDIEGVGSGIRFIGENLASSLPAMIATVTSGGLSPTLSPVILGAEANEELKEKLPDMDQDDRVAISAGAGAVMTALEYVGLGHIFRGIGVGSLATGAATNTLVEKLASKGIPKLVAEGLERGIAEGTTEALQEAVVMTATALSGGQYTREEVLDRLTGAFLAGGGVGGSLGAGVSLVSPRDNDVTDGAPAPVQPPATAPVEPAPVPAAPGGPTAPTTPPTAPPTAPTAPQTPAPTPPAPATPTGPAPITTVEDPRDTLIGIYAAEAQLPEAQEVAENDFILTIPKNSPLQSISQSRFRDATAANDEIARGTGRVEDYLFFRPTEQSLDQMKFTVAFEDVQDIGMMDPRINFLQPETEAEARILFEDAIVQNDVGLYQAALDKGLRILPAGRENLQPVGRLTKADLERVQAPPFAAASKSTGAITTLDMGLAVESGARTLYGDADRPMVVDDRKRSERLMIDSGRIPRQAIISETFEPLYDQAKQLDAQTPVEVYREAAQRMFDNGDIYYDGQRGQDYIDRTLDQIALDAKKAEKSSFFSKTSRKVVADLRQEGWTVVGNPESYFNLYDLDTIPEEAILARTSSVPEQLERRPERKGKLAIEVKQAEIAKKGNIELSKIRSLNGKMTFDKAHKSKHKGIRTYLYDNNLDPKSAADREYIRIARLVDNFAKEVSRLTNYKTQIDVVIAPNNAEKSVRGHASVGTDRSIVFLNTASSAFELTDGRLDETAILSLYAHEFGHVLTLDALMEAFDQNPGMREAILSAYERRLSWASKRPGSEGALAFGLAGLPKSTSSTAIYSKTNPVMGKLGSKISDGDFQEYYVNFNEWLANEVANWIIDQSYRPEALPKGMKWLPRLVEKIEKVFKQLAKVLGRDVTRDDFRPTPEMRAWLESRRENIADADITSEMFQEVRDRELNWSEVLKTYTSPQKETLPQKNLMNSDVMERVMEEMPEEQRERVQRNMEIGRDGADYFNMMVKYGWNVQQMALKNPHIQWLQKYVTNVENWHNEKMRWLSRANARVRKWHTLGKKQEDALAGFLIDLDQKEFMSQAERDKKVRRQPNPQELQTLRDKWGLDDRGFEMYLEIKKDFEDFLIRMEEIAKADLLRRFPEGPNNPVYIVEEAALTTDFDNLRAAPYFPHQRFGDWAIVVKDEKGKTVYMEHVEGGEVATAVGKTPKAVTARAASVQAQLRARPDGDQYVVGIDRVPEETKVYRGMPPSILNAIKANLGDTMTQDQKQWMDNFIIELAPAMSFRKKLLKRKNTPGFSREAKRAYADYFWHGGNYLARISYGYEMDRNIAEGKEATSKLRNTGMDVGKRRQMLDYLDRHYEVVMNPKPDFAWMRSLAFTWWIGFVPASALLNFTQVPMVTAPYLTAQFGTVSGLNEIRRATQRLTKTYRSPEKMEELLSPTDAKLIDLGIRQGFLDESMASELAATAEGSNILRARAGSNLERSITWLGQASGWMFQTAEQMNRRITFDAAVQLARKSPENKHLKDIRKRKEQEFIPLRDELRDFYMERDPNLTSDVATRMAAREAIAFLAGKDAVQRTQFEYARHARPAFMRGKTSVIFTFWMFMQNQLWFTFNSPGNMRFLLTMMATGGLMGLPGAEDGFDIAKFIGRRLYGKHFDVEDEIRKYMIETFDDPYAGDLLLRGTSRYGFGLEAMGDAVGLPIPSFDMSRSLGMGRIVPGVEALTKQSGPVGGGFEERLGAATEDVAGASLGIGMNIARFLGDSQLQIDDPKRWERAVPRALKNIIRAGRYTPPEIARVVTGNDRLIPGIDAEGRERGRSSRDTVLEFSADDPKHLAELGLIAMGFQPTRVTTEYDMRSAKYEAELYWTNRRGTLYSQYWIALDMKDTEARKDAIAAIKRYNEEVPYPEMKIGRDTLNGSMKTRRNIKQLKEAGLSRTKYLRRMGHDIELLYPEASGVEDSK